MAIFVKNQGQPAKKLGCWAKALIGLAIYFAVSFLFGLLVGDSFSKPTTTLEENTIFRIDLSGVLVEHATAWAVVEVTAEEIDRMNILNASIIGMQRALAQLHIRPEHIIVDGNKWKPYIPADGVLEIPAQTVVKGDGKYLSIAAASVLAKTYRDAYMLRLHEQYPQYHWDTNMGYPTKAHYEAIRQFGITPYHRKSFKLNK